MKERRYERRKRKLLLSRYVPVEESSRSKLFVAPPRYPTMLDHRRPPLSPCADHRCAPLNVCTSMHRSISTTLCSAKLFWRFRLLPRQRCQFNYRILKRVIVCHASASRNKRPVAKVKHVQTSTPCGQYGHTETSCIIVQRNWYLLMRVNTYIH